MADRSALGAIGLLFGATAIAVMIMATVVVAEHLTGRLQVDDGLNAAGIVSAVR